MTLARNMAVRGVVMAALGFLLVAAEFLIAGLFGWPGTLIYLPALHIANCYAILFLLRRFDAATNYRFTIELDRREDRALFVARASLFVLLFSAQCFWIPYFAHWARTKPIVFTGPDARDMARAEAIANEGTARGIFITAVLFWCFGAAASLLTVLAHSLVHRRRRLA